MTPPRQSRRNGLGDNGNVTGLCNERSKLLLVQEAGDKSTWWVEIKSCPIPCSWAVSHPRPQDPKIPRRPQNGLLLFCLQQSKG